MAKTVDIGFALNYQYANLLNITPEESEPTWAYMGPGIEDISPDRSEKTDETEDYSTGGNTVTTVTGVTKTTSVTGKRLIGDPLQEYVASLEESFGDERKTQYRIVSPTGEIIEEDVTLKDINITGPNGAASDKQAISFSMARNDTPKLVQAAKGHHLPAEITVEDVTVAVGKTATVAPTVQPATASNWCLYAIEDTDIARVTADGIVTGLKAGKTRLGVRCASKPSIRATVAVEVTEGTA